MEPEQCIYLAEEMLALFDIYLRGKG